MCLEDENVSSLDQNVHLPYYCVYTFKVSGAAFPGHQEFDGIENGLQPAAFAPSGLYNIVQHAFQSTAPGDSWSAAVHRALWNVGKFLLSVGESFNTAWDVALNTVVSLLKTGGAAFDAVVSRIGRVPVLGFGASGVNEAIKASVDTVESNARHDTAARRRAFAALNSKIDESGARLSGRTGWLDQAATTAGTVVFPQY